MRAIVIEKPGPPEVLRLTQVLDPQPGKGEVLVRVKATAINRADVIQRMGNYPPPPDVPKDIPGLEFAGVVEQVGAGVTEVNEGDRVCGLAGGGTYAELLVVNARTLSPIPESMTFTDAAAIPEVFITAYDAMVSQAGLCAGNIVLIHAVGSGVGTAAVQIAKAIGAISIGTARSADKIDQAKQLGLDHGIACGDGKFADRVLEVTGGKGVDVVLELVGGRYVEEDVKCMAPKGRIMIVGLVAGAGANLDLARLLGKRLNIRGTTLRMRPLEEKIIASQLLSNNMMPLFEKGIFKPIVDKVFQLAEAAAAHTYMEKNENFGKIVLQVSADD